MSPRASSSTDGCPYGAVALADFEAQHSDELGFTAGTTMVVISVVATDGWLVAILGSRRGLVPESYLARHELQPAFMCNDFTAENDSELSARRGERLGLVSLTAGAGWCAVVRTSDGGSRNTAIGPGLVPCDWVATAPAVYALADFDAETDDELSISEADVLWALRDAGQGWMEVLSLSGEIGIVPDEFLDLIDDDQLAGLAASSIAALGEASLTEASRVSNARSSHPSLRIDSRPESSTRVMFRPPSSRDEASEVSNPLNPNPRINFPQGSRARVVFRPPSSRDEAPEVSNSRSPQPNPRIVARQGSRPVLRPPSPNTSASSVRGRHDFLVVEELSVRDAAARSEDLSRAASARNAWGQQLGKGPGGRHSGLVAEELSSVVPGASVRKTGQNRKFGRADGPAETKKRPAIFSRAPPARGAGRLVKASSCVVLPMNSAESPLASKHPSTRGRVAPSESVKPSRNSLPAPGRRPWLGALMLWRRGSSGARVGAADDSEPW